MIPPPITQTPVALKRVVYTQHGMLAFLYKLIVAPETVRFLTFHGLLRRFSNDISRVVSLIDICEVVVFIDGLVLNHCVSHVLGSNLNVTTFVIRSRESAMEQEL